MKHMLPDSLFGRLMTAVLGAIVLSALVVALLIARERREAAFWRSEAAEVVSTIARTSGELAAMTPDERSEVLAALRDQPLVLRRRYLAEGASEEDITLTARAYQAWLERAFGARYRVLVRPAGSGQGDEIHIALEPPQGSALPGEKAQEEEEETTPGPATSVRVPGSAGQDSDMRYRAQGHPDAPVDSPQGVIRIRGDTDFRRVAAALDIGVDLPGGGAITFRTPAPQPAPARPRWIFLELGGVTVLLGLVLLIMTRGITRPLSELSRAADAMGRGARVAPLREGGARELREATRAFNAMQERLHRYLDSRTRVLAAMSHDLRTPLTRLRLRAESIESEEHQALFVADLDEMDHMVNNALDMFRGIDQSEELRQTDVGLFLRQLVSEFEEFGATVSVQGDAKPILVRPRSFKRCLSNLVSNAVKFGNTAALVVEDGETLVIRVCDDGPGIPEESLERVFEPFFRLEQSRNAGTGGAGLGLGIARDIAQAHGGSLVLRNRSPRGLEAVLSVPR